MDAQGIADELAVAERERKPIPPFTDTNPFLDVGTAYRAQWLGIADRLARGERLVGAKLGLTSRVMRRAIGIDEPLHGWLTSDMVVPYGEPVDLGHLIAPRAEPEIALRLGTELRGPVTITDVLAATTAVLGAVEILDSRYQARYRPPDAVADDLGAARFVLGPQARPPDDLVDLRLLGCVFRRRGRVVGTGAGGAVLGHPAAAVAWLVNTLAAEGGYIAAGSVVLTGGLAAPVPLWPGGVVSAEFDGLGTVEVHS